MVKIGWARMRNDDRPSCLFLRFWLLVTGCWLLYSKVAHACPGCNDLTQFGKDAVQTMRFGKGIAWSMALFFAVPVLLIGTAAAAIIYRERKAVRMRQNENL